MKNHWESDLDSLEKKWERYKKTNGHTWKSPFSALCPGLFPATPCSSVLLPLPVFHTQYSFPKKKPQKNSPVHWSASMACPTTLSAMPSPPTISAAATFSAPLLLQPPFLLSHPHLLTACGTPFQKVPPRIKVLLQLQKARLIPYGH